MRGGASGIGLVTVQRFLADGARVFIADIQAAPQQVLDAGARYMRVDVGDRDTMIAAFQAAEAALGKLDVIIHNAGAPIMQCQRVRPAAAARHHSGPCTNESLDSVQTGARF